MLKVEPIVQKAYELAVEARSKAYAPYSKFLVGAAIKAKDNDTIYTGCNVENVSFGATVCAERNAIAQLIVSLGKTEIDFVVVVTGMEPAIGPCALCLQVLCEFAPRDLPIYLANSKGIESRKSLNDFLPMPYTEFHLEDED